jgi:hypothetical protein
LYGITKTTRHELYGITKTTGERGGPCWCSSAASRGRVGVAARWAGVGAGAARLSARRGEENGAAGSGQKQMNEEEVSLVLKLSIFRRLGLGHRK